MGMALPEATLSQRAEDGARPGEGVVAFGSTHGNEYEGPIVLGEGVRMCALGLALGLLGSLGAARAIRAMLVGVSAVDVPTLAVVCPALLAVAALASLLPARRATRVSPTEALRGR